VPRHAHSSGWSPIVELRQYTLHPGRRDTLIDLFDSTFVETQEEVGMKIIGQFRDLDDPDRFVWLRGFRDMTDRARSLAEFYGGPVWAANREAANATMIDSGNVLLLRPAHAGSAFTLDGDRPDGSERGHRGVVEATVSHLDAPAEQTDILSHFEHSIAPTVRERGGSILGCFVTEPSENTFPSLPVREGEQVFVSFAGFADRRSFNGSSNALEMPASTRPAQVLRLAPTSRSLLHGNAKPKEEL
jgi:NIPSNAP